MDTSNNTVDHSRRKFLKQIGMGSFALCLGLYFPANELAAIVQPSELEGGDVDIEMSAWILISASGKVTLVCHRAEMGQGAFHSIPQIIAEELEVDLKDIDVVFAPGNDKKYGNQVTGGSSTIRANYKNLLRLSAAARQMLVAAAAAQWSVSASECVAESGFVIHKASGRKKHYGELAAEASKLETPKEPVLKKVSDYKLIRKPLHRIDTPLKTNGSAVFGIDKKIPGMLYAAIERNPRLRGKVKTFDDFDTRKVPGVKHVFVVRMAVHNTTTREGVAVVAETTWAAMQGKKALRVEWDDTGFEHVNTPDIFKRHEELLKSEEGLDVKTQGDPNKILEGAQNKLDVIYQTPYQSHCAMEPLNCVAHYREDRLEIWAPTQAPNWAQNFLSNEFKLAKENVTVNMTFLGGGFGRKAFMDYLHEAVLISKEIKGPVQTLWSREDDVTQGPYRPGVSYRCEGTMNNGMIEAVKFRMAGQNNDHWNDDKRGKPNRSASEGFLKPYYESIKNIRIADVPFETPIPTMWWRSVYASTNGFAYESFIDEMAQMAGKDPLDFRRAHLKEDRCQKLIDKLEEVSGWKTKNKNEGYGVAITECFASTVGQVVKVSKNTAGGIKIDKVWAVMDCGWFVNPDIIKAQVEGSVVMALGAATTHEITFKDGLAEQQNFYNYPMPRIFDIPPIEVYVMENDADAGGVGEPGLPPFAPALTNAIFDLTGKRIRKLPFNLASV